MPPSTGTYSKRSRGSAARAAAKPRGSAVAPSPLLPFVQADWKAPPREAHSVQRQGSRVPPLWANRGAAPARPTHFWRPLFGASLPPHHHHHPHGSFPSILGTSAPACLRLAASQPFIPVAPAHVKTLAPPPRTGPVAPSVTLTSFTAAGPPVVLFFSRCLVTILPFPPFASTPIRWQSVPRERTDDPCVPAVFSSASIVCQLTSCQPTCSQSSPRQGSVKLACRRDWRKTALLRSVPALRSVCPRKSKLYDGPTTTSALFDRYTWTGSSLLFLSSLLNGRPVVPARCSPISAPPETR